MTVLKIKEKFMNKLTKVRYLIVFITMFGSAALSAGALASTGDITLQWDAVKSAEQYRLEEKSPTTGSSSPGFVTAYIGKATKAVLPNREPGTYEYRVIACVSHPVDGLLCNESIATYSNTITITVAQEVPDIPTLTISYLDGSNNYRVQWTVDGNAHHYKLEESLDGGAIWGRPESLSGFYKDFFEPALGEYIYRVSSCNASNVCSAPSVEQNIVITIPFGQCAIK